MKKILRMGLLLGALLALLCVTAQAADETTASGIYNLTVDSSISNVTVTPQKADGTTVEGVSKEINNVSTMFYADAVKLKLEYSSATSGSFYLTLALSDGEYPTESNIAYIDQMTAGGDGTVEFILYPNQLESGKTYCIYLSSNNDAAISEKTKVASFQYYVPYTLGDVDNDGRITAADAQAALRMSVGLGEWTETNRLAADADKDGIVLASDALLILRASVGLETLG